MENLYVLKGLCKSEMRELTDITKNAINKQVWLLQMPLHAVFFYCFFFFPLILMIRGNLCTSCTHMQLCYVPLRFEITTEVDRMSDTTVNHDIILLENEHLIIKHAEIPSDVAATPSAVYFANI